MDVIQTIKNLMETPGFAIAVWALIPLLISGLLLMIMKGKTAKRICLAVFLLSFAVGMGGEILMSKDGDMQKQILREDPLVKRLAKEALKSSGSSFSEGGSAEVREPWLILHVGYKKGSRSEIEFSNIMYSGARLTQEALDEVKTICLWVEESWESADYIGAGGAKAHGTSKKACCWIADADSGEVLETYTLYSAPLPEKVSGDVKNTVQPKQVKQSVLDRLVR